MSRVCSRGLTLIELLVILAVIVVGIGLLMPAVCSRPRINSRRMVDSNNVRNTLQGLTIWSQSNRGAYPLPGDLDQQNRTIEAPAYAKDTTGNILSLLVFNGHANSQQLVSASEANPLIIRNDEYAYSSPSSAAVPSDALWDPAFRGTPDDPPAHANLSTAGRGHNSFAHLLPFGNRRKQWSDTYNSTEAVFGNRGPTFVESDAAPSRPAIGKKRGWTLLPGPLGTQSNTLLIHGGRSTWEGNIGYNDYHVNFETSATPESMTLKVGTPRAPGKPVGATAAPDNLFVNETDELDGDGATGHITSGRNAFLRPIAEVTNPDQPRTWRD